MIGAFGNIVFETSSDQVRTFDGFSRKGTAGFAEHPVMDGKPRLQHTGPGLDEIAFSIRLDVSLGINPAKELAHIRTVMAAGESYALVIGGRNLGRFVILETAEKWTRVDGKGRIYCAQADLTLKEDAHGH